MNPAIIDVCFSVVFLGVLVIFVNYASRKYDLNDIPRKKHLVRVLLEG